MINAFTRVSSKDKPRRVQRYPENAAMNGMRLCKRKPRRSRKYDVGM